VDRIEQQTNGKIKKSDFYPVPCVVSLSKLVEEYTKKPQIEFSAHPHCGMATYVFVDEKELVPINRFVDVDKFFQSVDEVIDILNAGGLLGRSKAMMKGVKVINDCIHESTQPKNVHFKEMLKQVLKKQNYKSLGEFHWNALFIGVMHFQDSYNYDIERVKRCVIHYATPDPKRRIIPFCAYNSGPTFREEIEQKYSIPLEEWESQHRK
ncbi:radical SAM protein, partial [Halobacteriota archaeon]